MTLPSKSTLSSSLGRRFPSGDLCDPCPDDLDPENLFERNEDRATGANDVLHPQLQSSALQQHADEVKTCKVCGDTATGMYFGALVCVPCKTFFLRYAGEGFAYECKNNKNCEVTTSTRTQCKFCRYQKCLQVGMCRRVRPAQVEAQDGQQLCVVCQDVANGVHFGVLTCEGCKKFFRRGLTEQKSYRCRGSQNCSINPSNRNACRYCRFQKCIRAGMSRDAIQMGRPSKMSIFEGHHRSQGKDVDKSPRDLGPLRAQPVAQRNPGSGLEGGRDCLGRSRPSTHPSSMPFPSWMEDPLMMPPAADNDRDRYDHIATGKPLWPIGGFPFVGKYSPPKAGSDEGEKSDGSACPDSTMVRDESDPFLPVDYTVMQRALAPGGWTRDEDYFQEWPETRDNGSGIGQHPSQTSISGGREASPVELLAQFKQEVLSSDDEGPPGAIKRFRHDSHPLDDCLLPQGFDIADADGHGIYSSSSTGSSRKSVVKGQTQRPNLGSSIGGDVNSSEFQPGAGLVGPYADPLKSLLHQGPCFPGTIETYIPNHPAPDSSAILAQPSPTDCCMGSPSVTSSSTHPFEGQVGSTRRSSFMGQEFEGRSKQQDLDFPSNRDDTGTVDLEAQMEEVGNQCWRTIKQVIPAYHRFVSSGTAINLQLKESHEIWRRENPRSDMADELSLWIQTTVVPAYTTVSVAYCKSLPDFKDLCVVDQRALIAGGQSQSRILAAALHWYDASEKKFRNFLSWRAEGPHRADIFKGKLREFAERISRLHLDPIEAALLNALGMFNSDHPNLQDRAAVEVSRGKILTTMKSYIAANSGAPGERLESLCQVLREAQVLGAEHVALTNTRTLGLPSDGKGKAVAVDSSEATVGQLLTSERS